MEFAARNLETDCESRHLSGASTFHRLPPHFAKSGGSPQDVSGRRSGGGRIRSSPICIPYHGSLHYIAHLSVRRPSTADTTSRLRSIRRHHRNFIRTVISFYPSAARGPARMAPGGTRNASKNEITVRMKTLGSQEQRGRSLEMASGRSVCGECGRECSGMPRNNTSGELCPSAA